MENAVRSLTTGKNVINGVYETKKVFLKIGTNSVTKYFKPRRGMQRRFRIEKAALLRLKGLAGVPQLIRSADASGLLEMSRLPGAAITQLSEKHLQRLSALVEKILAAGVARHSLPIRDIVVDSDDNVGLVDFERATLRSWNWRPDWAIAKAVTRYHLYRLIAEQQPQLLEPEQWRLINLGQRLRRAVGLFHSSTQSLRKPA